MAFRCRIFNAAAFSFTCAAMAALFVMIATPAGAQDAAKATIIIKDHKFSPAELTVSAGKRINLTVDNQDAQPEEFESHALKVEKVVPGNSKGIVRFGPLKPGRYDFVGEFHEATAKGVVVAE